MDCLENSREERGTPFFFNWNCSLTCGFAPSHQNLLTRTRSCSMTSKFAHPLVKLLHLNWICSLACGFAPSHQNLLARTRSCSMTSKVAHPLVKLLHLMWICSLTCEVDRLPSTLTRQLSNLPLTISHSPNHSFLSPSSIINFRLLFIKYDMLYETNRSEEHTSELQSRFDLVCRLLLEK